MVAYYQPPIVYITDTAKIKKQMNPNSIINYRKIIQHKGLLLTTYRECIASGFIFIHTTN